MAAGGNGRVIDVVPVLPDSEARSRVMEAPTGPATAQACGEGT